MIAPLTSSASYAIFPTFGIGMTADQKKPCTRYGYDDPIWACTVGAKASRRLLPALSTVQVLSFGRRCPGRVTSAGAQITAPARERDGAGGVNPPGLMRLRFHDAEGAKRRLREKTRDHWRPSPEALKTAPRGAAPDGTAKQSSGQGSPGLEEQSSILRGVSARSGLSTGTRKQRKKRSRKGESESGLKQ